MKTEEIFEFIEVGGDAMVDQIFAECITDTLLYEDEYIVESLDKYIEMLESDKVDEAFEEHLSNVMIPYFSAAGDFYEGVIYEAKKGPTPTGPQPIKKPGVTMLGIKNRAKMKIAGAKQAVKDPKKFLSRMRKKYGAKALGGKIQNAYQAAKQFAAQKATALRKGLSAGLKSASNKAKTAAGSALRKSGDLTRKLADAQHKKAGGMAPA